MEIKVPPSIVIPISAADGSRTGHARRQAQALASAMGFSEVRHGQLGIVVSEAAGNIAAHAVEGQIVLCPWRFREDCGIDVLALDKGRGIADISRSLEDGYSTAGTPGEGLGAISRLSAMMQIYSFEGRGTALFARVINEPGPKDESAAGDFFGVVSLPISGEVVCGDAWSAKHTAGRSIYIVADGLGHGPAAAEASGEAIRIFDEISHQTPTRILAEIHGVLTKTRGAAVSIAEISHDKNVVNYAGVGNVSGLIYHSGKTRNMVSMNGTLGHSVGRIQDFSYPWEKESTLMMYSDGMGTHWNLKDYPGLAVRHPTLIAGVLYRDFSRRRDDVTILVSRI